MSVAKQKSVKLSAKWQLDAALLSRPVDLTALVTMSRAEPDSFLEDRTLHRLVDTLLNEQNDKKSDKDTKLDVLNILANVATGSKGAVSEVRASLQGVSEWFDNYMTQEETTGGQEPELNKAMVLLLARCWDYRLKTEDVLELTQGNRKISLCTVVGLLEDGETYSTELKQRQKPSQGKMGQWEHELVVHRYEKPLLLQICRLLRGFTHPGTYFDATNGEIALYSVERFGDEMDTLLEITLRSSLVEKLSMALYDCLFEDGDNEDLMASRDDSAAEGKSDDMHAGSLEEYDHIAVASVHAFLQNLYFYATQNIEEYRRHMLMETLLIPRLVLPYLDRCVIHATILNTRAEAYADMLEGDAVAEMALHNPNLVKGMAASLRTLIIASFRAPPTQFVMTLLRRLNPTAQILRASAFCRHHEYIFALLCLLNVNMGALDLSRKENQPEDNYATQLLSQLAVIYATMEEAKQVRVCKRVMFSGALPISRDTPSYTAVMSILDGGEAGQLEYPSKKQNFNNTGTSRGGAEDEEDVRDSRAAAKKEHAERIKHLRQVDEERGRPGMPGYDDGLGGGPSTGNDAQSKQSAFQIAVSVAHAADAKDAKNADREDSKGGGAGGDESRSYKHGKAEELSDASKFRLLGDLPTLGGGNADKNQYREVQVALSLALQNQGKAGFMQGANGAAGAGAAGGKGSSRATAGADSKNSGDGGGDDLPKEFLCAINGHVMKDPVRVKSTGLVFEYATIDLWLSTRGAVCPITGQELNRADLEPAEDLRNRIKRYHIQQTTRRATTSVGNTGDDDLYDF